MKSLTFLTLALLSIGVSSIHAQAFINSAIMRAAAVQTAQSSSDPPMLDSIVAYWDLNGGAPMADSTGLGHTLAATDTILTAQNLAVITNCLRSTINSGVFNSSSDFSAGAGVSFTVSGWFKPFQDPATGDGFWCCRWHDSTDGQREWAMGCSASFANPRLTVRDLSNSTVTVTDTVGLSGLDFTHIAWGFDAANGVIWIQVNDRARVTQACSGVRSTAASFWLVGGSATGVQGPATYYDEVGFWKRAMSSAQVLSLYNSGSGWAYPFSQTRQDQVVTDWASTVVGNGGAAPSAGTKSTLSTYVGSLITGKVWPKMISANCFVPDSLIAAITPIIGGPVWTNNGFIAGDLTVNGLKGDGVAKYLGIPMVPSANPWPAFDFGNSFYVATTLAEAATETGVYDSGFNNAFGTEIFSELATFDSGLLTTARVGPVACAGWVGYLSGNRTANNMATLYKANSLTPHVQIGTNTTTTTDARSAVTTSMPVFCARNGASLGSFTSKRLSYMAYHRGLTTNESVIHFNAVQAMRVGLGGGYQ